MTVLIKLFESEIDFKLNNFLSHCLNSQQYVTNEEATQARKTPSVQKLKLAPKGVCSAIDIPPLIGGGGSVVTLWITSPEVRGSNPGGTLEKK